jgi:hypothetical protein
MTFVLSCIQTGAAMSHQKFVTYIRVSTQKQGTSGLGLDAQRQTVSQFLTGGTKTVLTEFVEIETGKGPDGHFKFPHLWPVKFPQAGRLNYQSFGLTAADLRSW